MFVCDDKDGGGGGGRVLCILLRAGERLGRKSCIFILWLAAKLTVPQGVDQRSEGSSGGKYVRKEGSQPEEEGERSWKCIDQRTLIDIPKWTSE